MINRTMRRLGIALLFMGFLWIALDTAVSFTGYQYTRWILQSKNLPPGETLPREDAVTAMRDLSLALNERHRVIFIPALLMFTGGVILAFYPKTTGHDKTAT